MAEGRLIHWSTSIGIALVAAACSGSRAGAPVPPAAPGAAATAASTSVEERPIATCREYDGLRIEAYWSPLPWHAEARRWIRIEGHEALGGRVVRIAPALVRGCEHHEVLDPDATILLGCVPAAGGAAIEITAEVECRRGPGRRSVAVRIPIDQGRTPGERLAVETRVPPPTPVEELNGGEELDVWRSRDAVPAWLRATVPADFDFARFMLAGPDPPRGNRNGIVIVEPAAAPRRDGHVLFIDYRYPSPPCPPCQGIRSSDMVAVSRDPTLVWQLRREDGVVFLRTLVGMCPPCMAP